MYSFYSSKETIYIYRSCYTYKESIEFYKGTWKSSNEKRNINLLKVLLIEFRFHLCTNFIEYFELILKKIIEILVFFS